MTRNDALRNLGIGLLFAIFVPLTDAQNVWSQIDRAAVVQSLEFRALGPALMSGRTTDIAVASNPPPTGDRDDVVIYVAAAAGGVWKSTDSGMNWRPIFDHPGSVGSIGAIAVAPSDPNVLYVGTGEANNSRSQSWGNGMWKSTDAGETWEHIGLRFSQHIGKVIVHPTNPNIVWVASCGPLWTSGGERGIYKTVDGGRTWQNKKFISPFTGFTDMAIHPTNPDILFATAFQRERKAYSFVAGGVESGLYKSTDGGETWREITQGIPDDEIGRMAVAVSHSNPNIVYVWMHHASLGGVYRSDDGGESFERRSGISSLPWYTGQIRVHPTNPDRVYHLGQPYSISEDGGRTWNRLPARVEGQNRTMHVDHHATWISTVDPDFMVFGNDGGVYISRDGAATVRHIDNLPVATYYAISVDHLEPFYRIFGGQQDNGSWGGPSGTRRGGVGNSDWFRIAGGDGFYTAVPPNDPNTVYAESQYGGLIRRNLTTNQAVNIRPRGQGLRFNWSTPLLLSPFNPDTVLFAAQYFFRSHDRGDTWETVSPDLTRQLDPLTLPIMGRIGPGGLARGDGTAPFGNISVLDESRLQQGLYYVGTDDGLLQVSEDSGATWRRVDLFPGVPEMAYVSRVVASVHDVDTVYIAFDHHRDNDFKPYLLRSRDRGRTFESIAGNLPTEGPVLVIREHHRNPNLLFVGTEFGVFATIDGGRDWFQLTSGIPTVAMHDLAIQERENDLVVGTHGRSLYVLDDITALERMAEAAASNEPYHLFPPRRAWRLEREERRPNDDRFFAPNPPEGIFVQYLIRSDAPQDGQLVVAFLDSSGRVVGELRGSAEAGLHRVNWDLTPTGGGERVAPGSYRVELRVTTGGVTRTVGSADVTVQADPKS